MKTGIEIIADERKRQIESEGWSAEHDKQYTDGSLAIAAASYALAKGHLIPTFWPWDKKWWKPTPENRIKELAKAGALIAAEIDRIQNLDK